MLSIKWSHHPSETRHFPLSAGTCSTSQECSLFSSSDHSIVPSLQSPLPQQGEQWEQASLWCGVKDLEIREASLYSKLTARPRKMKYPESFSFLSHPQIMASNHHQRHLQGLGQGCVSSDLAPAPSKALPEATILCSVITCIANCRYYLTHLNCIKSLNP